jgi:hypothetical protein
MCIDTYKLRERTVCRILEPCTHGKTRCFEYSSTLLVDGCCSCWTPMLRRGDDTGKPAGTAAHEDAPARTAKPSATISKANTVIRKRTATIVTFVFLSFYCFVLYPYSTVPACSPPFELIILRRIPASPSLSSNVSSSQCSSVHG